MLPGVARKVSLPFILLSAAGWIIFAVGFGLRNFRYKELSENSGFPLDNAAKPLDNAAKPEFFLFWTFVAGGLLVYIMSFVYTFWDHAVSKLLFNIFLPVFLVSGGAVLLVDGLVMYRFYQPDNFLFYCTDIYGSIRAEIHGAESYVVVEFVGVAVALFFYWVYLIISSFFLFPKKVYA